MMYGFKKHVTLIAICLLSFLAMPLNAKNITENSVSVRNVLLSAKIIERLEVIEGLNENVGFVHVSNLSDSLEATFSIMVYGGNGIDKSNGSGWLVDMSNFGLNACYVMTNSHVINRRGKAGTKVYRVYAISTKEVNGSTVKLKQVAEVLYDDPLADIAVLNVRDCQGFPRFKLAKSANVSQRVYAIGSPYNLTQSVTKGIISHTKRYKHYINKHHVYIQTDTPINKGNSGGPLVNADTFEVIAINVLSYNGWAGRDGVSFGVHYNTILQAIENLKKLGRPSQIYFGFLFEPAGIDMAQALSVPQLYLQDNCHGLYVLNDGRGDVAVNENLSGGDILLTVDGHCVNMVEDLVAIMSQKNIMDNPTFKFVRYGKMHTIVSRFSERYESPVNPRQDGKELTRVYKGYLGFEVEKGERYGTKKLVIKKVYEYSEAFWSQLLIVAKKPDCIVACSGSVRPKYEPSMLAEPFVGDDGNSVRSFQTIETVHDTSGRQLKNMTVRGLEMFARKAALSNHKLVVRTAIYTQRAKGSEPSVDAWETDKTISYRVTVFQPKPYEEPF